MVLKAVHTIQAKDANHATVTVAPGHEFDCPSESEARRLIDMGAAVEPGKEQPVESPAMIRVLPPSAPPPVPGDGSSAPAESRADAKAKK